MSPHLPDLLYCRVKRVHAQVKASPSYHFSYSEITVQPRSLENVFLGTTVTFIIATTGTQALRYQWKRDYEYESGYRWRPLPSDGDRIQGMETAALTIDKVNRSDVGEYRCLVSSGNGSASSKYATLKLGEKYTLHNIVH